MTLVRWYGQSAFELAGSKTVLIDPFGDISAALAPRGVSFNYPPITGVEADLLLVTHEHGDHNGVEAAVGEPQLIRSTAGTFETPVGPVVAVASEHDDAAGTKRGPNTLFRFELDGLAYVHLGDLGQVALRTEQRAALGSVDVLFVPVGDGPTIGGERAAAVVRELAPRLVVPMHYRTPAIDFLDPPDAFLDALGAPVVRLDASEGVVEELLPDAGLAVCLLAPPV